jgi:hypothetical protein
MFLSIIDAAALDYFRGLSSFIIGAGPKCVMVMILSLCYGTAATGPEDDEEELAALENPCDNELGGAGNK